MQRYKSLAGFSLNAKKRGLSGFSVMSSLFLICGTVCRPLQSILHPYAFCFGTADLYRLHKKRGVYLYKYTKKYKIGKEGLTSTQTSTKIRVRKEKVREKVQRRCICVAREDLFAGGGQKAGAAGALQARRGHPGGDPGVLVRKMRKGSVWVWIHTVQTMSAA